MYLTNDIVYHAVIVFIVVRSMMIVNVQCVLIDELELEQNVGECGLSNNGYFEFRSDAARNEFPWNAQLFYSYSECVTLSNVLIVRRR